MRKRKFLNMLQNYEVNVGIEQKKIKEYGKRVQKERVGRRREKTLFRKNLHLQELGRKWRLQSVALCESIYC